MYKYNFIIYKIYFNFFIHSNSFYKINYKKIILMMILVILKKLFFYNFTKQF